MVMCFDWRRAGSLGGEFAQRQLCASASKWRRAQARDCVRPVHRVRAPPAAKSHAQHTWTARLLPQRAAQHYRLSSGLAPVHCERVFESARERKTIAISAPKWTNSDKSSETSRCF